jgi:hypothetical protein
MVRVGFVAALAVIVAAPLCADEQRDRKARVALALAARPSVAVAPAPHAAAKCYQTGYDCALEKGQPLVVFVGCAASDVEGAVVARADTLTGVDGPAVVVAVPQGGRLLQDAVLPCPTPKGDLERAVKAAARKVDSPAGKGLPVAPRPLKWDI